MNLPPPRITDDRLDALPLDAGLDHLLAGLLASPTGRLVPAEPRRWPALVAVAAAVALIVTVPTVLLRGDGGSAPVQPPPAGSSTGGPTAPVSTLPDLPAPTKQNGSTPPTVPSEPRLPSPSTPRFPTLPTRTLDATPAG